VCQGGRNDLIAGGHRDSDLDVVFQAEQRDQSLPDRLAVLGDQDPGHRLFLNARRWRACVPRTGTCMPITPSSLGHPRLAA
jgi:hypothetical protein